LKITRALPQGISDVSIDQLLWDVHLFLCAHPPSKYRNKEFMPLRLLKTVPSFSSCCCWARLIFACAGLERARQTEGRFHSQSLVPSQLFTLFSPCFFSSCLSRTLIPVESQPTIVTCVPRLLSSM
jgi:hypothetical protein